MHDKLAHATGTVSLESIYKAARDTHLDLDHFFADLGRQAHRARVARDVVSADESGVTATPAFFVNGQRYGGAFDPDSVATEIRRRLRATNSGDKNDPAADLDPVPS